MFSTKAGLQRVYDPVLRNRPVHRVIKISWRDYKVGILRREEALTTGGLREAFTEDVALRRALKSAQISKD